MRLIVLLAVCLLVCLTYNAMPSCIYPLGGTWGICLLFLLFFKKIHFLGDAIKSWSAQRALYYSYFVFFSPTICFP